MEKQAIRQLLLRAERARKALLQPYFVSLGITLGQGHAKILNNLLDKDHITQRELADICHMDTAAISRSIDKLEEAGFLVREREPGCRRSFFICLTEKGVCQAKKVRQGFDYVDTWLTEGLSAEELTAFCGLLEKVCRTMEEHRLPAPDTPESPPSAGGHTHSPLP